MLSTQEVAATAAPTIRPADHPLWRVYRERLEDVVRSADRILRDRHTAEDVAHDAFLRLSLSPSTPADEEPLLKLVFTTTRNRALNLLRWRDRFKSSQEFWAEHEDDVVSGRAVYSASLAPWPSSELASGNHSLAQLRALPVAATSIWLHELLSAHWPDGPEREVLLAVLIEHQRTVDAAQRLGVSPETARTWVARARRRLKCLLGPHLEHAESRKSA